MWCKVDSFFSLLQSSVSHDPSVIMLIWWFAAQQTLLTIINVEKSFNKAFNIFVETDDIFVRVLWTNFNKKKKIVNILKILYKYIFVTILTLCHLIN